MIFRTEYSIKKRKKEKRKLLQLVLNVSFPKQSNVVICDM